MQQVCAFGYFVSAAEEKLSEEISKHVVLTLVPRDNRHVLTDQYYAQAG